MISFLAIIGLSLLNHKRWRDGNTTVFTTSVIATRCCYHVSKHSFIQGGVIASENANMKTLRMFHIKGLQIEHVSYRDFFFLFTWERICEVRLSFRGEKKAEPSTVVLKSMGHIIVNAQPRPDSTVAYHMHTASLVIFFSFQVGYFRPFPHQLKHIMKG